MLRDILPRKKRSQYSLKGSRSWETRLRNCARQRRLTRRAHNAVTTTDATLAREKGHYWNNGWNWNKVFRCAHSSPGLQEAQTSGMLGEGCMGSCAWFLQLLGADLNYLKMKVFFRDHKINGPWGLYARTRGGPCSAKDWPHSITLSKPRTWPSRDTQNPGSQPTRHTGFRAESSQTS